MQVVGLGILLAITSSVAMAGEYCGPRVEIPKTTHRVSGSQPECAGNVKSFMGDIADIFKKHGKDDQGWTMDASNFFSDHGIGNDKYQTNANCMLVCAAYPQTERVVSENIYWSEVNGPLHPEPYGKAAYDRWDAGPGWHRIDSVPVEQSFGSLRLYCHQFRNFSDTTDRAAKQCVNTQ